ncbi:MAG: 4'-phosphopantetheinyl transferase superfamily protein [Candidatus Amulumruptor caecigallinarius]|nr:4'-phosphopantetheinyl transferase superfamily protein [Candidatus Amulumruptor caecigallinarius]
MESEMVYWRHPSVAGIKIEEITEGFGIPEKIWIEMARQLYCENGRDIYREIGHFSNGAPFLYGETSRISISHCKGLFIVATLPSTPEVNLADYSDRAALGIDAERADRKQVIRLREKFLSQEEMEGIAEEDVESNILAWTIKEAAYKAALTPGIEFASQIKIHRMPKFVSPTPVFAPAEYDLPKDTATFPPEYFGQVEVVRYDGTSVHFMVMSYKSEDFIVTLAYSQRSAKFGKL